MADVTTLDPAIMKRSLSDGTNLKPSLTTTSYTGGTPSAAAEVKAGLLQADGTLKPSLLDASGSALKAGLKI